MGRNDLKARSTPSEGNGWRCVLPGALMLLWPALYNRFPLVYPDSINYLGDGHDAAAAIVHWHLFQLGWMRAPLYSLGIFFVHWRLTPWPVVALHAVLLAWVLWLVMRSVLTRGIAGKYFGVLATLCLFTGVAWVTSWILPDILGPMLYLSVYLLVFAPQTLTRKETVALCALTVWSANGHITHLILGIAFAFVLALGAWLVPTMRSRRKPVRRVWLLVGAALVLQITANGFLTGSPTLTGKHPPFLTGRLLSDGPARRLLQERCPALGWAMCRYVDRLPTDSDEFLWGPDNIMAKATPEETEAIAREEGPLLRATLRAYPREQFRVSLANFRTQLTYYDIEGFSNNTWAEHTLPLVMPHADAPYHRSLQSRDAVNSDFFNDLQLRAIPASLVLLIVALPFCWRRRAEEHAGRLLALTAVVVPIIIANAMLTGVLSVADSRYQVRVIWLLPFVTALLLLHWLESRRVAAA